MKESIQLKSQAGEAIAGFEDAGIALLRDLVRTPSLTGEEILAQQLIEVALRKLNLEIHKWSPLREELKDHPCYSDDGLPLGNRPVIVARWPGNRASNGRSLILNGHIDVVPPGDSALWFDDPWSGAIRDGKLWGRGSCDMKAGLVSGILALQCLKEIGFDPAGEVLFESVIGEETGGVGTLSTVLSGYKADAALILEPTRLAICPAGAGAASFRFTIHGKSAHGAMRQEGISAIEKFNLLLQGLQEFETKRNLDFRHPLFAPSGLVAPISIGKIHGGNWPSTVPETVVAEGRYGILPGESIADARRMFEDEVRSLSERDPWLRDHPPSLEWFEGQFEPAETPADAPIVTVLKDSHRAASGVEPACHGVSYGSDLRFFTNVAKMQGALYGPGDVRLAHSANECVSIAEMMLAAKTLAFTIIEWCGG